MHLGDSGSCVEDVLHRSENITSADTYTFDLNVETNHIHNPNVTNTEENSEKLSAVWSYDTTKTLLKLYENRLELLETPKKKTGLWICISEGLKDYNIKVTPDQVRWKINALTKKYKQCLDDRKYIKFKYFREMDKIFEQYNFNCNTFLLKPDMANRNYSDLNSESKTIIELRQIRLANRIECDRTQSKNKLEKQWLEYLKREQHSKLLQDKVFETTLKIKEAEIELQDQHLQIMESLEIRSLQMKERQQNEMLGIEREKCGLLLAMIKNKNTMKKNM